MQKDYHLSKNSISILKGIAMIFLVFHNFLIFQPNSKFYNEEKFNSDNIRQFLDNLWPVRWYESFSAIMIFLGHYGVQIFIFCTAYGLTQLYKNENFGTYYNSLKSRLLKLLILLGLGIFVYIICYSAETGRLYSVETFARNTILLLSTAGNFSKNLLYTMFSGPFWYFGLTIQLLFILPFLYKVLIKRGILLSLLFSYSIIYPLYYIDLNSSFSIFGNILGHLPEVFVGIYLATHGVDKIKWAISIIALCVYILSQMFTYVFPLSFVSILVLMLFFYQKTLKLMPELLKQNLLYIGTISMILFILNGYFRFLSFFNVEDSIIRAERIFLYFITLIITSHLLHKVYIYLLKKLKLN